MRMPVPFRRSERITASVHAVLAESGTYAPWVRRRSTRGPNSERQRQVGMHQRGGAAHIDCFDDEHAIVLARARG